MTPKASSGLEKATQIQQLALELTETNTDLTSQRSEDPYLYVSHMGAKVLITLIKKDDMEL